MIKIAKIVNTHGINGELRLLTNSDFVDQRFSEGSIIYVDQHSYEIEYSYEHKTFIIIKLRGYDNINDVLFLKNKDVYGEKLDQSVLDKGEYFNQDLVNLTVKNVNGQVLGEVIRVEDGGVYNYLRIKGIKHGLVPFNQFFIIDVDLEQKEIIINEIEGLLNEN